MNGMTFPELMLDLLHEVMDEIAEEKALLSEDTDTLTPLDGEFTFKGE